MCYVRLDGKNNNGRALVADMKARTLMVYAILKI